MRISILISLAAALAPIATRAQTAPPSRFAAASMDTFLYGAAFYE
jgi:hypothetical protein